MAVIWIVTIGNSDVKLTSEHQWGYLREQKREELKPCYGDFKQPTGDSDGLFLLPARVMGIVYGDAINTHWQYFDFPLLAEFTRKIKSDKKHTPDRIIVLLTNQEQIFLDNNIDFQYDRSDPDCPYWKDTCRLEPILRRYFNESFGTNKAEFCILEPRVIREGLDHWDSTLRLVQRKFLEWRISEGDRIIISHQAGTPAISSAVQLTALLRFGKKVQFLVSNEFIKDQVDLLPGSSYFGTLQIQEAQQLLRRFDYAGVRRALGKIEFGTNSKQTKLNYILELLELAELWNAAKFDEFAQKIGNSASSRSQEWWWKGYEMAYLAWIRMFQENPTEALFHSVRAIEGLICEWAIKAHSPHIRYKFFESDRDGKKICRYYEERFRDRREGAPVAKKSIDQKFSNVLYDNQKKALNEDKLGLHGQTLYALLKTTFVSPHLSNIETHPIRIVWEQLADERNELFHRLKGITENEVYEAWGCKNREQWGKLLFDCVQLVSNTQDKNFKSLKQGSLITSIHESLKTEIDNLLHEELV